MRKAFVWTNALLLGVAIVPGIFGEGSSSAFTNEASANAAAQTKKRITVPAGTRILIRMVDSIDTTKQTKGYRFTATLETNLQAEDTVVAPRGTTLVRTSRRGFVRWQDVRKFRVNLGADRYRHQRHRVSAADQHL